MDLAPIVLFVYNRPWHTRQVLESLKVSTLSGDSKLYIFSDGPKLNADQNEILGIEEVRKLIQEEKWCGDVEMIQRDQNLGLAQSIITGVSEIISKYGKVIVLEDDLIVGKHFLEFLNNCLNLYYKQKEVYGISGYKFHSVGKIHQSTFFLPIMSSWGWATWSDRWDQINFDANWLLAKVKSIGIENGLDYGGISYYKMLQDQAKGIIDSWAIRFYVSMFIKKGVFLFPNTSLLSNVGFDSTGIHSGALKPGHYKDSKDIDKRIDVSWQTVKLNRKIVKNTKHGTYRSQAIKEPGMKTFLKRTLPAEFIQFGRRKLNNGNRSKDEVRKIPRYTKTQKKVLGEDFEIPDLDSFIFMYKEIFVNEIYKFYTGKKNPYIIDGGANIGLSSVYFKALYPHSKIIAFEPDPEIFEVLTSNLNKYNLTNVELINKGLWDKEQEMDFWSEGADSGLVSLVDNSNKASTKIRTTSLNKYLDQEVDLLKLDIEGAETVVLKDIQFNLDKVKRIFIEYHSFKDKPQTVNDILDILKGAGFRFHINSPGGSSKSPFVKLNIYNNMDMQLNIFGFKNNSI